MQSRDAMRKCIKRKRDARIDIHTHAGINPVHYAQEAYPYGMSVEDLVIRMETLGIDFAAVFPFGSFYYDMGAMLDGKVRTTTRVARFPYEIANRNLLKEIHEVVPGAARRLLPFAMFDPSRKQAEQVDSVRDLAAERPLFGLKTVTSYNQAFITDLLKKKGRVILDLAAELDIPVLIHSAVFPGDPWANVFEILKVVTARPDVRFCIAHTCRFDRRALDTAAELPNCWVDLSAFHIHCQLAVTDAPAVAAPEDRFPGDYGKPVSVMKALAKTYPDTICWGTDTPAYYWMSDWVDEKGESHTFSLQCEWDTEAKALRRLTDAAADRIGRTNSLALLFGDGAE